MKKVTFLLILFPFNFNFNFAMPAQENVAKTDPLAGHSFPGEVFNQCPLQAALLIP